MSHHITSHIKNHELRSDNTLHVIGVISNPARYHSRYRLAREWIEAMEKTPHVKLYMVESAFGDRHHEVSWHDHASHLQVRTKSEIWTKECQINLGEHNLLPADWKYMAWVDCDVFFDNPNWALETIHALQHWHVVQPWENCIDLGHHGSILENHRSFGSLIAKKVRRQKKPGEPYVFGHPGFAWACDRYFWENVRGLMDFAILGSADHHMACALVNEVGTSMHSEMSDGFKRRASEWQTRAYRITKGHVGYIAGFIRHKFHGPKKRRFYRERWQMLVDAGFDPDKHLMYDAQGLIQLTHDMHHLEHDIRGYNRSRFEDSIEEV